VICAQRVIIARNRRQQSAPQIFDSRAFGKARMDLVCRWQHASLPCGHKCLLRRRIQVRQQRGEGEQRKFGVIRWRGFQVNRWHPVCKWQRHSPDAHLTQLAVLTPQELMAASWHGFKTVKQGWESNRIAIRQTEHSPFEAAERVHEVALRWIA
jgi:hypothetical protein